MFSPVKLKEPGILEIQFKKEDPGISWTSLGEPEEHHNTYLQKIAVGMYKEMKSVSCSLAFFFVFFVFSLSFKLVACFHLIQIKDY